MTVSSMDGGRIARFIAREIQLNKDHLSEVDGLIGDGDHGINMNKGFTLFTEKLGEGLVSFEEAFKLLGRTLLSDIGGSMGPLYGTFFIEMSKKAKDRTEIDAGIFADMLDAALDGVKQLGNAEPGDKTLVDVLEPAARAFRGALDEGEGFGQALFQMRAAAQAGRDSTIDMVAKVGRASRLGERSCGTLDAGAASCCIILCALADAILRMGTDVG